MKKAELKAYTGVLKTIAKSNRHLDTLKGVAISEGEITATNLDTFATLAYPVKGEAVYDSKVLDLIQISADADLTAYQTTELRDFPEFHEQDSLATLNLNTRHSRGTLGELLIHALDFVSTDMTRPALTGVWLDKSEVVATDGYRAYASDKLGEISADLTIGLPAPVLKLYKKVMKYGDWTIQIASDYVKLTNGTLTIFSKQLSGSYPSVRNLMNGNRLFTHKAVLPYAQIKALATKTEKSLGIGLDGSLTLENRPLPFSATIAAQAYEHDQDGYRTLLCGLIGEGVLIDATLLSAFKPDKDGNITIRFNTETPNRVYSVIEPTA